MVVAPYASAATLVREPPTGYAAKEFIEGGFYTGTSAVASSEDGNLCSDRGVR